MADRWPAKLARPIVMRDGTKFETLAEAGSFILALPEAFQHRNSWLKATELLMEAAERERLSRSAHAAKWRPSIFRKEAAVGVVGEGCDRERWPLKRCRPSQRRAQSVVPARRPTAACSIVAQ
jgi:hypothetical protein